MIKGSAPGQITLWQQTLSSAPIARRRESTLDEERTPAGVENHRDGKEGRRVKDQR